MEEPTQPDWFKQLNSHIRRYTREHLKAERIVKQQEALEAGDVQPDDLLTVAQAAGQFGTLRKELYKAIQLGKLRPIRSGPPFLLRRKDVYEFVRERVR